VHMTTDTRQPIRATRRESVVIVLPGALRLDIPAEIATILLRDRPKSYCCPCLAAILCLEPIRATDKVRGLRDDLMHEGCDNTRRETPPPGPKRPPLPSI
jgi:hypothetical protein